MQDNFIYDADAQPFLSKDAAQSEMKAQFEDTLKSWDIDPDDEQTDEREWECGEDTASIREDISDKYESWKITEHDLPDGGREMEGHSPEPEDDRGDCKEMSFLAGMILKMAHHRGLTQEEIEQLKNIAMERS